MHTLPPEQGHAPPEKPERLLPRAYRVADRWLRRVPDAAATVVNACAPASAGPAAGVARLLASRRNALSSQHLLFARSTSDHDPDVRTTVTCAPRWYRVILVACGSGVCLQVSVRAETITGVDIDITGTMPFPSAGDGDGDGDGAWIAIAASSA
jgi:hypothetical protein